jgi:peptidoglycan LD-endopeptidase LytH
MLAACSRGTVAPAAPMPAPTEPEARSARPVRPTLGARPAYRSPRDESVTEADLDALWARQIMVPVEGVIRRALRDDFEAARSGGQHRALDLLAPRFTAILAADDCVIGRLSTGPVGGIVVYATDPTNQFVYYYAHLQRYRRGLAVGDRVAKGSVIGYVGTSGNAPANTPHLHFQVMKRGTGRAWWDGPSINPLLFFASDGVRP